MHHSRTSDTIHSQQKHSSLAAKFKPKKGLFWDRILVSIYFSCILLDRRQCHVIIMSRHHATVFWYIFHVHCWIHVNVTSSRHCSLVFWDRVPFFFCVCFFLERGMMAVMPHTLSWLCVCLSVKEGVCVCVCVCVRARGHLEGVAGVCVWWVPEKDTLCMRIHT